MPSNNRFKPRVVGETVHLWLDTQDIMTCIDAAKTGGVVTKDMSFNQAVKWGIVVMCETMRRSGALPVRDAFDYEGVVSEFFARPLGTKVKAGLNLNARELAVKMQEAQTQLFTPYEDNADIVASGLPIPQQVKLLVPCGSEELSLISGKVTAKDENLSNTEIAKWLLYSGAREYASKYLKQAQIDEAELLILSVWPRYPKLTGG